MLKRVAMVRSRMGGDGAFQHFDRGLGCLVAVRVHVQGRACPMKGLNHLAELSWRKVPQAVWRSVVIAGPFQACGESLNGPVDMEFDRTEKQRIRVVAGERFESLDPVIQIVKNASTAPPRSAPDNPPPMLRPCTRRWFHRTCR